MPSISNTENSHERVQHIGQVHFCLGLYQIQPSKPGVCSLPTVTEHKYRSHLHQYLLDRTMPMIIIVVVTALNVVKGDLE